MVMNSIQIIIKRIERDPDSEVRDRILGVYELSDLRNIVFAFNSIFHKLAAYFDEENKG